MYFCWGTDPEQSPPMRMDRIVSTGCVPDCTPSHFQNFENGGEIYTFDAKKDYAHAFLPSRNSNDSRIVWIPATQETEGESSKAGITYIGCAAKASDIVTGHVSGLGVVDLTFPRFDKIMQSTSEKVLELKNVARYCTW